MSKVSIKGVLIGGVVDVGSSMILGVPLVIYAMAKSGLLGASRGSVQVSPAAAIHASPWLYGVQLSIGLGCSAFGGYVAAWIAKHDEVLNGFLSSYLCTAIGISSMMAGKVSGAKLEQLFLLIASPLCSLLGGYLRRNQKGVAQQAQPGVT
jgi:hypothetical protein